MTQIKRKVEISRHHGRAHDQGKRHRSPPKLLLHPSNTLLCRASLSHGLAIIAVSFYDAFWLARQSLMSSARAGVDMPLRSACRVTHWHRADQASKYSSVVSRPHSWLLYPFRDGYRRPMWNWRRLTCDALERLRWWWWECGKYSCR